MHAYSVMQRPSKVDCMYSARRRLRNEAQRDLMFNSYYVNLSKRSGFQQVV